MRIKLKPEQLEKMSQGMPFDILLDQPRDVRGFLDLLGHEMPWDETGLSKFSNSNAKPPRLTFSVESGEGCFICDIHPALAQHIYTLLSEK